MDAYIQSKDCRDSHFMDAHIHGRLHLMLLPCGEFWHPKTHVLMQKRSATAVGDSGFTLMQNTQEDEKLWEHDAPKTVGARQ